MNHGVWMDSSCDVSMQINLPLDDRSLWAMHDIITSRQYLLNSAPNGFNCHIPTQRTPPDLTADWQPTTCNRLMSVARCLFHSDEGSIAWSHKQWKDLYTAAPRTVSKIKGSWFNCQKRRCETPISEARIQLTLSKITKQFRPQPVDRCAVYTAPDNHRWHLSGTDEWNNTFKNKRQKSRQMNTA